MKKGIRLTESGLRNTIKNVVKKVLQEENERRKWEDYIENHSERTRFKRDNGGYDAMKTLKAFDDGGCLPYNRTASEDSDMRRDFKRLQMQKKINAKANRSAKRSDKAWQKAADSRPLHRKGSLNRFIESANRGLSENTYQHMTIDDICDMLGGGEKGYDALNMILWSLQEQGVIEFHEDALDELYNAPSY